MPRTPFPCQLKWRSATQLVGGINIPTPAAPGYYHTPPPTIQGYRPDQLSWSGVLSSAARQITTLPSANSHVPLQPPILADFPIPIRLYLQIVSRPVPIERYLDGYYISGSNPERHILYFFNLSAIRGKCNPGDNSILLGRLCHVRGVDLPDFWPNFPSWPHNPTLSRSRFVWCQPAY